MTDGKKETKKVINDIKVEFLSLINKKNNGYIISLENVYTWLENPDVYTKYKNDDMFRRDFRRRYLRDEKIMMYESNNESDLDHDYIMRKTNNIKFPWFSVEGFKMFCLAVNENKARYVRKYFIEIEKDYLRVINQTDAENKKELKELTTKMNNFESNLLKTKSDLNQTIELANKYEEKYLVAEYENKKIKYIKNVLDDADDFATAGNPEYVEYKYIKTTYYKKVGVYIVNPEYIKPKKPRKSIKKNSDVESEPESEIAHNDYNNYDVYYDKHFTEYDFEYDINQSDSPELFYYIAGLSQKVDKPVENFYKITDLYVKDAMHLKQIREVFDTNELSHGKYYYKTGYKYTYNVNYNFIYSTALTTIQEYMRCQLKSK